MANNTKTKNNILSVTYRYHKSKLKKIKLYKTSVFISMRFFF